MDHAPREAAPAVRRGRARRPGRLAVGIVAVALLLVAAACGSDDSTSSGDAPATTSASGGTSDTTAALEPATVRLISWSTPRTEQASIFAAESEGFFADQAIEFEYIPGQGSGDSLRQLLAGNGEVAFAGPEGIFLAVDQGEDVVAVYNTYPQNVFVLVAKADSGIETVADLRGKSIGVLSMASGGRYNTNTVLEANGLKESDVTLVATGPAPTAFIEGQVDAFMTLSTTVGALEAQGMQLNKFPVVEHANLPTDVFAMTRSDFEDPEKRDVVVRFLRAYQEGTQFMIDEVDAAVQIGIANGLDITDPVAAKPVIEAFGDASQSELTAEHGLGWFDLDEIQAGADLYYDAGLLSAPIDVSVYFTNELVEQL
jgi:NitT/TauT family transport system substrate-binding protein